MATLAYAAHGGLLFECFPCDFISGWGEAKRAEYRVPQSITRLGHMLLRMARKRGDTDVITGFDRTQRLVRHNVVGDFPYLGVVADGALLRHPKDFCPSKYSRRFSSRQEVLFRYRAESHDSNWPW